jgi:hypothetical protein
MTQTLNKLTNISQILQQKNEENLFHTCIGMHKGYWWESQNERDHYEKQDVGGWTILKWILREIGWDGMDWIELA